MRYLLLCCFGLGSYLYDYAYTGYTYPEEYYITQPQHKSYLYDYAYGGRTLPEEHYIVQRILPHHVLIEPIPDDEEIGSIYVPRTMRQMHVQRGWVTRVSDILEEDIRPDDLVVFVGWKELRAPARQYGQWEDDLYSLHEDDIELVIEDW